MFLLDTNVVSALNPIRIDEAVKRWTDSQSWSLLHVSVVTVLEIDIGIQRLARKDKAQARRLRRWLEERVLTGFSSRILPVELSAARAAATLHVPDPAPERDALIAATAMTRRMTVVTRNVKDFKRAGVPIINPWED